MALGGSTNAVVHLLAIAGRLGIDLTLDDFDRISRTHAVPGEREAFGRVSDGGFFPGGRRSGGDERAAAAAAWGLRHGQRQDGRRKRQRGRNVSIATWSGRSHKPLAAEGGTAMLYGNLAPDGAVIKPTAASPHLLQHRGRAVVFENHEQMKRADRQRRICRWTPTPCW